MTPTTTVENAVMAETPVIDCATLRNRRCTPLREDQLLALLRRVGLDDADAAERLVQPAGHFRVDLAALAEERPEPLERQRHRAAEGGERDDGDRRQAPVQIEEIRERGNGGDDAADELDETDADQVPDAFRVGHDARDQNAGLRRIEVADRQPRDVRLDPPPHVGDGALRGHAEHLREREGRHRLHERRERRPPERAAPASRRRCFPTTSSMRNLEVAGQDEPRDAIDEHERPGRTQGALAVPTIRVARLLPGVPSCRLSSSAAACPPPRRA